MSPQPRLTLPKEVSIPQQAAESIRTAIADRYWEDILPSDRRLSKILLVSRPSVRAALQLLAREGIVQIRHGRSTRIIHSPRKADHPPISPLVGLITPRPFSRTSLYTIQGLSELKEHLAAKGFRLETFVHPNDAPRVQLRKLGAFVRSTNAACYILTSLSRATQWWFMQRGIRCLILGSRHDGITLPALTTNYRAVCHHAAGLFVNRGHRRIALMILDSKSAGDMESEAGFLDAIREARSETVGTIVRHDGSPGRFSAGLRRLMRSPRPPTALLIAGTYETIIATQLLARARIDVPRQVSIIARDEDPLFTMLDPTIAHYRFEGEQLYHRLTRMILNLVRPDRRPASRVTMMFPSFVSGGSLARAPDA